AGIRSGIAAGGSRCETSPAALRLDRSPPDRQGKGKLAAGTRPPVDAPRQFQRLAPCTTIGVRMQLSANRGENAPLGASMAVPVDIRRVGVGSIHLLVVVVVILELPGFHAIRRGTANRHRPRFSQDGDGSLEVSRIGEHCNLEGTQCSAAELEYGNARILGLDLPGECRGLRA